MSKSRFIAERIREVFLNGQWIANTNYKVQLEKTNLVQATTAIGETNTIAKLTFHINYYLEGLIQVLQGGPLDIKDKYSFDCPPILNELDWKTLTDRLLTNASLFANLVEKLSDETLQQFFVEEKYGSYARNMEAVIEHSYYHLGQIVLIRKMLEF